MNYIIKGIMIKRIFHLITSNVFSRLHLVVLVLGAKTS